VTRAMEMGVKCSELRFGRSVDSYSHEAHWRSTSTVVAGGSFVCAINIYTSELQQDLMLQSCPASSSTHEESLQRTHSIHSSQP
jgi:hypothetical protein